MRTSLQGRIQRLEETVVRKSAPTCHPVLLEDGEPEDEAKRRYEREKGRTIAPGDFVICVRFVDPRSPASA